jgi:hypothetical protein
MERQIVIPLDGKPGRFSGRLESTDEVIVTGSKQPLADGARGLLARGFDPGMLLTMRHKESSHDSFQPLPIGKWTGWTYEEGETKPLRRVRWMPFPTSPPPGQCATGTSPFSLACNSWSLIKGLRSLML